MFRRFLIASALGCILPLALPTGSVALTSAAQNPVSAVGKATKDAGKGVVKGTKDAAGKTATETKNAAETAKGAVTPDQVSASCKDGTVQTGKTGMDACAKHGGVKKERR